MSLNNSIEPPVRTISVLDSDKYLEKYSESEINKTLNNWDCVINHSRNNGTLEDVNSYIIRDTRFEIFSNETFIKMIFNRTHNNTNLIKKLSSLINIFHNGI